jgi:tetratricopeptide (TPR) repeat protein
LSVADEWDGNTSDSLFQEIEIFRKLRSAQLQLPVHFEISLKTENACGKNSGEFIISIRKNIAAHTGVIVVDKPSGESFLGKVEIWNDRIVVFIGSMPLLTYHLRDGNSATQQLAEFVNDVFVAIGLALWRVGQPHVAARIISLFSENSNIIHSPAFAVLLARCFADADRVSEALQLSQRLLQADGADSSVELLSFSALVPEHPLSIEDNNELIKTLKIRVEEAVKQGDQGNIACAYYSLANALRSQGRFRTAFHYYHLAVKKDGSYLQRDYFCEELGAILFEMRRYKHSVSYYRKAIELGRASCKVFLADALMFSGEYQEASNLFKEYLKTSAQDTANPEEWKLKVSILDMIIGVSGQSRQTRQVASAMRTLTLGIAEGKEKRVYLEEALGLDYLCPLAWFNMGVQNNQEQKHEDACLCFLVYVF